MRMRSMSGLDKAFEFIEARDERKLCDFNRKKATAIYELARKAPAGGVLLELGAYRGIGIVPIWYGAQDGNGGDVVTLDRYVDSCGWIGEPYGPSDEDVFWANMEYADISPELVKGDIRELARTWDRPFAFLIHDLGRRDCMPVDVMLWERHAIPGAVIALRDIDDYSMGTEEAVAVLQATGRWGNRKNHPSFITSLERIA